MELLESDDPKSKLLKKAAMHRDALGEEAKLISDRTEKAITNALIIGGALAVTYFMVRQFSGTRRKKKVKARTKKIKLVTVPAAAPEEVEDVETETHVPGMVTQIGTALITQASAMLLSLAKEKLTEYLQSQLAKKSENNERS
jgi:hypothetical protein